MYYFCMVLKINIYNLATYGLQYPPFLLSFASHSKVAVDNKYQLATKIQSTCVLNISMFLICVKVVNMYMNRKGLICS